MEANEGRAQHAVRNGWNEGIGGAAYARDHQGFSQVVTGVFHEPDRIAALVAAQARPRYPDSRLRSHPIHLGRAGRIINGDCLLEQRIGAPRQILPFQSLRRDAEQAAGVAQGKSEGFTGMPQCRRRTLDSVGHLNGKLGGLGGLQFVQKILGAVRQTCQRKGCCRAQSHSGFASGTDLTSAATLHRNPDPTIRGRAAGVVYDGPDLWGGAVPLAQILCPRQVIQRSDEAALPLQASAAQIQGGRQ